MSRILLTRVLNRTLVLRLDQNQFNQFIRSYHGRALIGKREVVGYGNGSYSYFDKLSEPYPAIRFREDTPEVKVLREKEKGDWHNLTIEEKKTLYRSSFWRTFAEVEARNGDWKFILGLALLVVSMSIWTQVFFKVFKSMSEENRKKMLRLMLDLKIDPVQGVSSKWDYELDCWKSQREEKLKQLAAEGKQL